MPTMMSAARGLGERPLEGRPTRDRQEPLERVCRIGDEVDVESYLFVTQIINRRPSNLSSGLVRWTLRRTSDGYRVKEQHTVLDSIESAPFHKVDFVAARQKTW